MIINVFKIIFVLLCFIQLIYLATLLLVYNENTNTLKTQMDLNTQLAIIKLRDLMKEYIETKVTVLANDIIPVLTTLDQLSKEKDIDSL